MECLIGITGKDFVVMASDNLSAHSIIAIKHDSIKQFGLSDKMVMSVCGDSGDMVNYAEYIQKNLKLYEMIHGYKLTPHAAANFSRKVLAKALRSNPYQVNLLLGGVEDDGTPSLYFMDYLASMCKEKYAAHGYGSFFILSTMDKYYKDDMTREEAVELLKKCIREVQARFIVNLNAFTVQIIDKTGITRLGDVPDVGTAHPDVPREAIHPHLVGKA